MEWTYVEFCGKQDESH